MSEDVEDLFGEQLKKSDEQQWSDGIYTVRGKSMKKGIYRTGKWEGRPFARFMYEMEMPDGEKQQASQMLPWLPGKAFFEINFKLLTGMSLSDFNTYCRSQDFNDAAAQSKFFLEKFRDTEFEAEIRKSDRWYNIWEIKRRIEQNTDQPAEKSPAAPSQPVEKTPEISNQPVEKTPESSNQAVGKAPEISNQAVEKAPGVSDQQHLRLEELREQLKLSQSELEGLCREEFSVDLPQLQEADLATLIQLLTERAIAGQSDAS